MSIAVLASADLAHAKKCPKDTVQVGPACVDKYEASVWSTTDTQLIRDIQKGKIDVVSELVGATQHGVGSDDYGVSCPDTGNGCTGYYAVSLAGVTPSGYTTWFQAAAACRNSGKRLATNQEWQAAAFGTPDPGTDDGIIDCNVDNLSAIPSNTGSRSSCESDVGAFDMVGNVQEWVAEWTDTATSCSLWDPTFGDDVSCMGGDGTVSFPGAMLRGGYWLDAAQAGVFAVDAGFDASSSDADFGFRCARNP
jgi:hypothetical protein